MRGTQLVSPFPSQPQLILTLPIVVIYPCISIRKLHWWKNISPLSILILPTATTHPSILEESPHHQNETGQKIGWLTNHSSLYQQWQLFNMVHASLASIIIVVYIPSPPHPHMMIMTSVIYDCCLESSQLIFRSRDSWEKQHQQWGVTWSVLAFITIINPHSSIATTCSCSPQREPSLKMEWLISVPMAL